MKTKYLHFYAAKADLESLLEEIESRQPLQYVETGLFDSPAFEILDSLRNIKNLGDVTLDDLVYAATYLVAKQGTPINVQSVPKRRGGTKHAFDQLTNPKTITFRPGGKFRKEFLISGQLGTASHDSASLELFQLFSKEIKKQFRKVQAYYVGEQAHNLLRKGWRLTPDVKSPIMYDLE